MRHMTSLYYTVPLLAFFTGLLAGRDLNSDWINIALIQMHADLSVCEHVECQSPPHGE